MLHTIEGVYRDGEVALKEQPELQSETPVLVTFLSSSIKPVTESTERQQAWQRIQNQMTKGHSLGGAPYPSRGELHERHHQS